MLNANELRNGDFFTEGKNIFRVLTYEHMKTGRGSGNIKLKAKNIRTGSIVEKSYITGAKLEEAFVEKVKAQFVNKEGNNFNFKNLFDDNPLTTVYDVLGDQAKYLKEGLEVILLVSEEEVLGIELPLSLVYTITETGPEEKGNTVSNIYKEAVLDNGLVAKVPMFAKDGIKVRIDTRTGEYIERVKE